jgi:hypothetical protein
MTFVLHHGNQKQLRYQVPALVLSLQFTFNSFNSEISTTANILISLCSKPLFVEGSEMNRFFFAVVLILQCPQVSSFAAWLKCYVDITDPGEIIMNSLIVPSAEAHHEGVQIEVKYADDDHWVTESFTFNPSRATQIMARLKVPPALSEMDVQYVMDIVLNSETSPVLAKFIRPANICEGRRGSATHYSDSVVLEIPSSAADGTPEPIRLVAGYATGHEAVTLTEPMILQPRIAEEEL